MLFIQMAQFLLENYALRGDVEIGRDPPIETNTSTYVYRLLFLIFQLA